MILAVHSSPKPEGNLERMVRRLADASGRQYRLIRLSEREIAPCRGCVRCAATRRCVLSDDMADLYPDLEETEGLIMGGTTLNGRFDALAHTFLERLFPLYHLEPALRDLPAAVVAVGGEEPENAGEDMRRYLEGIHFLNVVGTALFKSDTPPCFSCGYGAGCRVGMPALNWPGEAFSAFTRVEPDMFRRFEDNEDAVLACDRVGSALGTALSGRSGRPWSGGGFYVPHSG